VLGEAEAEMGFGAIQVRIENWEKSSYCSWLHFYGLLMYSCSHTPFRKIVRPGMKEGSGRQFLRDRRLSFSAPCYRCYFPAKSAPSHYLPEHVPVSTSPFTVSESSSGLCQKDCWRRKRLRGPNVGYLSPTHIELPEPRSEHREPRGGLE